MRLLCRYSAAAVTISAGGYLRFLGLSDNPVICAWESMSPGIKVLPCRSNLRAPDGSTFSRVSARIRPFSTSRFMCGSGFLLGSIIRLQLIKRAFAMSGPHDIRKDVNHLIEFVRRRL